MSKQIHITIEIDGEVTSHYYVGVGQGLRAKFGHPIVIKEADASHDDTMRMEGFVFEPIVNTYRLSSIRLADHE